MVSSLLVQLQIFWQFYLIDLVGFLIGLELLWHLINWRLVTGFGWLASFLNKLSGYRVSCQGFGLFYSGNEWLRVVLDGISLQEYCVNAGVLQGFICLRLFLLNTNDILDNAICNIADGTNVMILCSTLSVIGLLICGNSVSWLLDLKPTDKTMWTGAESGLLISMLEKLYRFHLTIWITDATDVRMD